MGTTMNRWAYEKVVAEDIAWLLIQPRTLERDHIEQVLRDSPRHLYPPAHPLVPLDAEHQAMRSPDTANSRIEPIPTKETT
jgi:hypothetical protein